VSVEGPLVDPILLPVPAEERELSATVGEDAALPPHNDLDDHAYHYPVEARRSSNGEGAGEALYGPKLDVAQDMEREMTQPGEEGLQILDLVARARADPPPDKMVALRPTGKVEAILRPTKKVGPAIKAQHPPGGRLSSAASSFLGRCETQLTMSRPKRTSAFLNGANVCPPPKQSVFAGRFAQQRDGGLVVSRKGRHYIFYTTDNTVGPLAVPREEADAALGSPPDMTLATECAWLVHYARGRRIPVTETADPGGLEVHLVANLGSGKE
jgi:hypothetical protein